MREGKNCILPRAAACLLALALLLCPLGCVWAASPFPAATNAFFVNDFAKVLSAEDEALMQQAGEKLYAATAAQVVLVTVDDLGGMDLETYSLGLAREWGIGQRDQDNGILLLFTTDGPHSRIEVGYGMEGALPDSKAGRILDTYLVPAYEEADAWSEHLTDTYKALVNVVYGEYDMTEEQYELPEELPEDDPMWIMMLPILLVFVLGLLRVFSRGARGRYAWLHTVGHILTSIDDDHHSHGGFGGGFHGGGFHGGGFHGGGGGFGGGGASR